MKAAGPIWPGRLLGVSKERDSARVVAVRFEQENARLEGLLAGVATDLREMHADEAIDLESWPAASEVVIHVFVEDRFAEVPS